MIAKTMFNSVKHSNTYNVELLTLETDDKSKVRKKSVKTIKAAVRPVRIHHMYSAIY